ncbi:hypothetical protein [Brevundimonas sp.]|uniref:hypothetical protein n=1 Tax=Brevundimonas sp. TaxID=1871086 RepID=UPI00289C0570|nr:hypothetical protein [Brevundimonas sp.]
MWTLRIASFVTLAAAIATWITYHAIKARYIGAQLSGFDMFKIAHPVNKLGMILLFMMGVLIVIASLIDLFLRQSEKNVRKLTNFEIAISISTLAAIGLSTLLTTLPEMGLNEEHPLSVVTIALQKLEHLFFFNLALWPSAFAFLMLLVARTRRAKALTNT